MIPRCMEEVFAQLHTRAKVSNWWSVLVGGIDLRGNLTGQALRTFACATAWLIALSTGWLINEPQQTVHYASRAVTGIIALSSPSAGNVQALGGRLVK